MVDDKGKKIISQKKYVLMVIGATFAMVMVWFNFLNQAFDVAVIIFFGTLLGWLFLVCILSLRRLRALDKPTRYAALAMIPIVGIGLFLYLAIARDKKTKPYVYRTMTRKTYIKIGVSSTIGFMVLLIINLQAQSTFVITLFSIYLLVWRITIFVSAIMYLTALQKSKFLALFAIIPLMSLGLFFYLILAKGHEINASYQFAPVYLVNKEQEDKVNNGQEILSNQMLQKLYDEKNKSLLLRKLT